MSRTYYGYPPVRGARWTWQVPTYLFLGGVAGGAAQAASVAHLAGGPQTGALVRAGRTVAAAAGAISPVILSTHLGRVDRAHHMLRVAKPSSPMNAGAWLLAAFSGGATLAALDAHRQEPSRWLSAALLPLGSAFGSYTGALLAGTANPLWAQHAAPIGVLTAASSAAAGAAAVDGTLAVLSSEEPPRGFRGYQALSAVAEGVALAALAREAAHSRAGRHLLRRRALGWSGAAAAGLGILGASVHHRGVRAGAAVGALAATFALRRTLVDAGDTAADDPEATFAWADS